MQESTSPRARLWVLTAGMLLAGLTLAGCERAEDRELLTLIEEIAQLRAETLEVIQSRIEFAKASEESSTPRNPFLVSTTAEALASQRELRAEASAEELEKLRLALEEDAWETEFPETFMFGTDVQPRQIVALARNGARDALEAERERLKQDLEAEERRAAQAAEREERLQQTEERRQVQAAELEGRRQAAAAAAAERRQAAAAAEAERLQQAEEARLARKAELREQIPARIEAIEKIYDAIIATHEEAVRTHQDPEEQRQARGRATMASFAKRQTLGNIEGRRNMPSASLESVFRTVEAQYRTAEGELTAAREKLAEAQAAAAR